MSQLASYLQNLQRFGIRPGLERIAGLLESAGNPQNNYPIVLLGGTNGKGSTCEFTARFLQQGGRRIGLYTSPHLYKWNERIRVLPGEGLFEGAVSDEALDQLFLDALPHIEKIKEEHGQPTEFEVVTFLGLWHFARQQVDAAVIEVGLGGKWDATNVTEPRVSVVTHVALDHMDRLGNTLEEIAADKVCISRPNRPFITGETKLNVLEVFRNHCEKVGAQMQQVPPVGDDFQAQNENLAREITRTFSEELGWDTVLEAHFQLEVPGRAEVIAQNPQIIIDAANNPEGAEILAQHVTKKLQIAPSNLILVLGILADKDFEQMTRVLVPLAKKVIVTQSDSPRAATTAQVAAIARQMSSDVEEVTPVVAAVERAKEFAEEGNTILVTGSFTTISEVPR